MSDPTIKFKIKEDNSDEMKKLLLQIYEALQSKGYNPVNQLVGYILSEDPTSRPPADTDGSAVPRGGL